MWLGTIAGLNRFDGRTVRQYFHDPKDPRTIPGDRINALFVDSAGDLWLGTEDGLARHVPRSDDFERFDIPSVLEGRQVLISRIRAAPDGGLWLATWQDGLIYFDPASKTYQRYLDNPDPRLRAPLANSAGVTVRTVSPEASEQFWVATYYGVWRADKGGLLEQPDWPGETLAFLKSTSAFAILPTEAGLWLGTTSGLWWISLASGLRVNYPLPQTPAGVTVHRLFFDSQGGLWVGADTGLFFYDPDQDRFLRIGTKAGLPDGAVVELYEDAQGILWVGTDENGVAFVDLYQRPIEVSTDQTPPGHVWAFAAGTEGQIWVGGSFGLGRLPSGDGAYLDLTPPEIQGVPVAALLRDRQDRLWVGTDGAGLCLLVRSRCSMFTGDAEGGLLVYALAEDREGRIWVGTFTGLYLLDPVSGFMKRYRGTSSPFIMDLEVDRQGVLWVASNGGVDRLNPVSDRLERVAVPQEPTFGIAELPDGRLWVEGMDLMLFNPSTGEFMRFPAEPKGRSRGLAVDEDGGAWLAFSGAVFHARADGTTRTYLRVPARYRLEFWTGGGLTTPDGEVLLGFEDGFLRIRTERLRENPFPPKPFLSGIRLNDNPFPVPEQLLVTSQDRVITFEMGAAHFSDPASNGFEYLLDGFESEWRTSRSASVTYTNLEPRRYVFRMRARASNGILSPTEARLALTVAPTWWQRSSLRFLVLVVFSLGLVGAIRLRYVAMRRRTEELEGLVSERTIELNIQADQLRESDANKRRFFANISHELRTPLALLQGYLEPLARPVGGAEPDHRLVRSLGLVERMNDLVGQLVELARAEGARLQLQSRQGDLNAFVVRVVDQFATRAESEGIQLEMECDEGPIWTSFDPGKLEQAISNLIDNALKFVPRQGRVWVSVEELEEVVQIAVADNGPGIPPEQRNYIFERFYQVDTPNHSGPGGLGIGLALGRDLVRLHGGDLEVGAGRGTGSVFTLTLPKNQDPDPADTTMFVPAPAHGHPARPRLLLVEDDPEMRAFLSQGLGEHFDVAAAADGESGWHRVREFKPDVILSDLLMPRLDGSGLLARVRSDPEFATVPFVLLSGNATDDVRMEALRSRADDIIDKPFSLPMIRMRLRNLVAMRRHLRLGHTESAAAPSEIDVMEALSRYVRAHIREGSIPVSDIAEAQFVSVRTLQRRVKEESGMTVSQAVRLVRLEEARSILERREARTLSEAGRMVGFNNVSYFADVFRETFGEEPTVYLKEE